MRHLLTGLRYLLATLSALVLLLTLVSVVPSTKWWVQVLGFPRFQALVVLAVCLLGWLALSWPAHRRVRWGLLLGCGLGLVVQASFLWPYLPFAPKAVPAAPATATTRLRILVINVLMTNRQDARLRQLVTDTRPDVLLALEPDDWWARALRPLQPSYPYRVELPRSDAYGMILYSRLPLAHTQVQNLLQHGVPSIRTRLRLPDGRQVTFLGIHPTPPVPDTYPDGVGLRGAALEKVTNLVRESERPAIVAGDFNDVSWSGTIQQLTHAGELHDVSRGRGLFNTFDARSHLARWPLDHFFVSTPFQVVELKRLADVGSDHFPLYIELALPD
ncbi:endonuclease/exonuclease/phosphatase family protein [Hymenobacter sp. H14-R3]|uniref:endonuclease/exonuclease/phosphatase family protein n=1 Tax=Hymenobacter sp. H14-R3 TaxID=3046308 RepID=UPI0024B9A818|nr:endonuclease/exonuclease/phosphatase family protein [Hymenobacter sp. H14-R3]MDJ0363829.1 endonuclease/exonuclease/phosphatase family protein [Hymenobacter sp. H14-R3]